MTNQTLSFYVNYLKSIPLLTREEEVELAKKIQQGDKNACNKLVTSNMRFVVSEAYKYRNCGLPIEDLICEGNIGLMSAAEKFIPGNAKFITYAAFWVHEAFNRAIHKNRLIHIPENRFGDVANLPSAEISFDASCSNDDSDSCNLSSFIADDSIVDPEEEFETKEMCEEIANMIDSVLDKRTATMVRMHFGLSGFEQISNADIGRRFGVGRENVRQILARASEKMRSYIEDNNLELAA